MGKFICAMGALKGGGGSTCKLRWYIVIYIWSVMGRFIAYMYVLLQTCTSLKFSLPILAALDLQEQNFNKLVFLLPLPIESPMTNNQPNTRRPKLKPWKTKAIQPTPDPQFALVRNSPFVRECVDQSTGNQNQGSSPTLAPSIVSTLARSSDIAPGKLERLKKSLPFSGSNQAIASASMKVGAFIQAELSQALHDVFHIFECCSLNLIL